jgi:hypothetical protein
MQKIIESLSNLLWHIRFTFADGARHKQLWKEEKSILSSDLLNKAPNYYSDPKFQILSSNIYNRDSYRR